MPNNRILKGKFWPDVRARIWEKAEEMHAADFYNSHTENITPPTRAELRESGYFHRAKLAVLRELNKVDGRSGGTRKQDEQDYNDYIDSTEMKHE